MRRRSAFIVRAKHSYVPDALVICCDDGNTVFSSLTSLVVVNIEHCPLFITTAATANNKKYYKRAKEQQLL